MKAVIIEVVAAGTMMIGIFFLRDSLGFWRMLLATESGVAGVRFGVSKELDEGERFENRCSQNFTKKIRSFFRPTPIKTSPHDQDSPKDSLNDHHFSYQS